MLHRIRSNHRLSQAVVANGFVFLSGQGSEDPSLDVAAQTRDVLHRIDELLREAGSGKERIVFADISLSDIAHAKDVNTVWDAWVDRSAPPARACAEKRVSAKPYLVEISVIAVI
ncbi:RidA family protein [Microvirga pudoricolor]|uniref:RidA family protein n=1 Tax=Microvirga pudoricolor TaxID=2778729 RepID=UPI001950D220|nr:RidA family protein [Microvirga pudoricolor]MBM6595086.1 RidA family protein [Microvirga pudoricolor]